MTVKHYDIQQIKTFLILNELVFKPYFNFYNAILYIDPSNCTSTRVKIRRSLNRPLALQTCNTSKQTSESMTSQSGHTIPARKFLCTWPVRVYSSILNGRGECGSLFVIRVSTRVNEYWIFRVQESNNDFFISLYKMIICFIQFNNLLWIFSYMKLSLWLRQRNI